jgi:hypothetical protein
VAHVKFTTSADDPCLRSFDISTGRKHLQQKLVETDQQIVRLLDTFSDLTGSSNLYHSKKRQHQADSSAEQAPTWTRRRRKR